MNIIIMGANRGIGLELTKFYSQNNHNVIALCRNKSPELEKIDNITVVENIDVTDSNVGISLHDFLPAKEIDLYIHNSGLMSKESIDDLDFDRMRAQFEVNTLGPLNLIKTIRPYMKNPSKICVLTSRMGSLKDNESGGMYGYRISKAAANMACVSLAHDLKSDGVAIGILHPGFVKTDMTNFNGNITPDVSAKNLTQVIEKVSLDNSGTFWHCEGEKLPY